MNGQKANEICSTPLVIRKMKIKFTVVHHYMYTLEWLKFKRLTIKCWWRCRIGMHMHFGWENKWCSHSGYQLGNFLGVFSETPNFMESPLPNSSLSAIYPLPSGSLKYPFPVLQSKSWDIFYPSLPLTFCDCIDIRTKWWEDRDRKEQ